MYIITIMDAPRKELDKMLEDYDYDICRVDDNSYDFPLNIMVGEDGEIDIP